MGVAGRVSMALRPASMRYAIMYNDNWLRIEIEKWLLKKGWAVTAALLTLAVMAVTALAAGAWFLLAAVLFPLAVRFTVWAVDAAEQAVLDNDWPGAGLIPIEEMWQRAAVAGIVGAAVAVVSLVVWLVVSLVLVSMRLVLPLGWVVVTVVAGCIVLGIVCVLKGDDDDDDMGGIFLGRE